MKWSSPFFDHEGPVCFMSAFKQHCAFGFWKAAVMDDPKQILNQQADTAVSIGRITSLIDLPDDEILIQYIRHALSLNIAGTKSASRVKSPVVKPVSTLPAYFMKILEKHPVVKVQFEKFSPSQKKEYLSWFEEAKTEATRIKRLDTAIGWISEGEIRHWKYK